ncbi:MAG: glycosyltransferase [Jatrophihabitans sp.]|uniref:glycosyltransferase n=1 Tax=Jatrophihabitans sp. TaxID=1932789 RepID=UPI003F7EE4E8
MTAQGRGQDVIDLHDRLVRMLDDRPWELVVVQHGDAGPGELATLAAASAHVRYEHRGPIGRNEALLAAVRLSTADRIVVASAALDEVAASVPALMSALNGTDDLAVSCRPHRSGRRPRSAAHLLLRRSRVTADPTSTLFAMRRHVLEGVEVRPDAETLLLEVLVKGRWARCTDVPAAPTTTGRGRRVPSARAARRRAGHLARLRRHAVRERRAAFALIDDPALYRRSTHAVATHAADRPLRILILTSEAPPVVSGISRAVGNLHRSLSARGHQVDVVSRADFPHLSYREFRFSAFVFSWRSFAARLEEYDVVNVHGPVPTMSEVFLMLMARRPAVARPRIVYTHHSDLAIPGLRLLCAPYNLLQRRLARVADAVLVSSDEYAGQFAALEETRVEVVPWGIETADKVVERAEHGHDDLRVLFVGQLRPYKGLPVLLQGLRGLDHIRLTVIGDGPERSALEAQVAEWGLSNVRFLGRVDDDELWRAYSAHDVIALPSVTSAEAYGIVLVEGMAAGCVPLASDLPGVRGVAGPSGVLVRPGDADSIREALRRLQADPTHRRELAAASVRRASALTAEATATRHEALFRDTLRDHAGRVSHQLAGVSVLRRQADDDAPAAKAG